MRDALGHGRRHANTRRHVGWRAVMILLLALGGMWPAQHAHAQQTLYWSGTAGTATPTWNTPLAWSTGSAAWVPPAAIPGASDTAVFGIASLSGPQLIPISGTQSVFGLVFSSTSPTALSGTNGSSVLTIGAGGITVTPSGNFYVFGLDGPGSPLTVALSGSTGQRWDNQSSNVPNLHGPLVRDRGATLTMLAPFALRSATNTFGMLGPWATYEGGSAVGYLTVGAGGTMTAFTGATPAATAAAVTDTTGTMNYDVAGPGALGPNASFNTLRYTGGVGTISGSLSANGLMNAGDPGNGTLAFSGRMTAGATGELVVAAGRVIDLQGTIADGGGPSTLVKTGTGTLILSGNNSYTGGTVVNDGTVMMVQPYALGSGTSSLAVSSGTLSIGGYSVPVSSLTGAPGGTIAGSGTLTVFAAANSTYAGGFASGGMPSSPTLVKSGSGALTLSGSNSLASIAINGGRLVAGHANALGGGTTAITVNAGTLDIGTVSPVIGALTGSSGAIITTAATAGVRTLTTSIASGSPVYAGSIQDNGAGTIGLTTYGAAALTLSGSNSFTGPTRLVAGGVTIANRDALAGTTLDLQAGDTGSLSYNVYSGTMNIGGLTGSRTITFPSYATIAIGGNSQSTTFSGTLSGSGAFVKQGGGTLTLTGSAPMLNPYTGLVRIAGGTLALGSPGALAGATVEMNPADAGTLAFSGTAPQTYYLAALTGTRNVNIGGNTLAIGSGNPTTSSYDGTLSGSGGLIKVGSGTLALTNTNAYTGTTRIQAGVLQITNRDALAGTTLDLQAGDTGSLAISVFSGTLNIGGLTGSRSFDVSSNRTTAIGGNGQSTSYAGTLSGSGPFVKQGAGTLTLTGSTSMLSPYTGTVRIAGGTLALGNPAALAAATVDMNYDDAGTLAFSGTAPQTYYLAALTGWRNVNLGGNTLAIGTSTSSTSTYDGTLSGSGGLIKVGSSTLVLTTTNAYTGTTRIEGGTLRIVNRDALAGSTLDLQAGDTGSLSISVNSGTVNIGGLTGSRSFAVSASYTTAIGGNGQNTTYSGTLSGTGVLVKQGAGTLTLTGSAPMLNPYTGTVRIAGGTLALGNPAALAAATVDMNSDDAGTLAFSGTAPQTFALAALTGWRGVNLGGNTLAIGTSTSSTSTYDGTLTGSGGLIKVGSSTLVLTNSNAYTGTTRIESGTLRIDNRDALAGSTLDLQASDTGTLWINVFSGTVTIGGLAGSRSFDVSSTRTNAIGGNGQSTTYSGTLSGTGVLVKQGAGTLTLTGSTSMLNPYTGTVRIAGGTLALGNPAALAAATVEMNPDDAGTLAFSGTAPQTFALAALTGSRDVNLGGNTLALGTWTSSTSTYYGTLSGSGGLIKFGSSTLVLTNSNAYTGPTRIEAGTLQIANRDALAGTTLDLQAGDTGNLAISVFSGTVNIGGLSGSRPVSMPSFVTVAVGGNGQSTTYSGTITQSSGAFVKQGAGTLTLTATGALSGGTVTVNEGRLVGSAASLGSPIFNNATLEFAQATSGTFGGLVLSSTNTGVQTVKSGAGTLTLTGTIFGNLTVSGGRLVTQAENIVGGQLVADGTVEFAQAASGTFSGTLAGSGGLVKTGAGTLALQGGTFNGTTTVSGGRLVASAATLRGPIVANATLEFAQAINGEHVAVISGSGTVVKSGPGTLLLSGANLFAGTTSVVEGILATAAAERLADASTVSLAPDGSLRLGGNETIATLLGSGSVNLQTFQLTIAGGGTFAGGLFGSGGLTKAGPGSLALSGSSGFLGATRLNAGTLVLSSPSALSSFTTLSIASGATLVLDTDVRVFAYTNAGTITGAGQLLTSATTATSGTLTALSDASGPDGYSVGLLKTSTDTLVVSGSTSFTGGVVVEQGTVQLAAGGAFAPTNVVEVQSGATLDLNGQSQTVAALSGGGGVALGGGTLTVASTTDTVFDGAITGGSLVKAGSSVLDLTGSSTVSTATVSEGVLSVNGTLTGDVAVAPAGVLGGAGTIVGDVAVSGTHAPGNSPDISTITGDLTYAVGAAVIWELAANTDAQGPLAARTHDQIVVGEDLAFTGSTSLVLSFFDEDPNSSWISTVDWTDPFWDEDRTWTLWDVTGTTTGFGNLSIAPGSWLDANGTPIASIRPDAVFMVRRSGSDVLLVYSVPEPGTLALAAGGLACAAWGTWRRRRRSRHSSALVGGRWAARSTLTSDTITTADIVAGDAAGRVAGAGEVRGRPITGHQCEGAVS